ncbi:MAG: CRTAC1 family protein [Myxococcota bacterium]
MIRDEGEWFYVGDGGDPPLSVDALVRAQVTWFGIPDLQWFEDITEIAGLDGMRRVAWGDYDNDGYDDLLVNGNRLFRNNGDGSFTETTYVAGIGGFPTNGGIWADYNNDGYLDFYATAGNYLPECSQENPCIADGYSCYEGRCQDDANPGERIHDLLWMNNGDGTFTEVSFQAGVYDFLPSEGAAWGDINNDGQVDLYVANYEIPANWTDGVRALGTVDYLWVNNGDGTFTDRSEAFGVRGQTRPLCGRGVNFGDFNEDGWIDLYVSNYRLNKNYFFKNLGSGMFTDISHENGTAGEFIEGAYGHTIGSQWADFNNDGYFDLIVANLAHPRFIEFSDKTMLYLNQGPPNYGFAEIRDTSGITYSETHSDPATADFDNDGNLDLFITDVYVGYSGFLYRNSGDAFFEDVTYLSGISIDNGWGCAWSDFDNDGDLDFIANRFYQNNYPDPGNYLQIKLVGTYANRAAIGAVVKIWTEQDVMVRQVEGGKGTTSQNSQILHFGLGDATMVQELEITWPIAPLYKEQYYNIPANQRITYVEREGPLTDAGIEEDAQNPNKTIDSGCSCNTVTTTPIPINPFFPLLFFLTLLLKRKP